MYVAGKLTAMHAQAISTARVVKDPTRRLLRATCRECERARQPVCFGKEGQTDWTQPNISSPLLASSASFSKRA